MARFTCINFSLPLDIKNLSKLIYSYGGLCILVGGSVRDMVIGLGCSKSDYDLEVYFLERSVLKKLLVENYNVSFVGAHFGVFKVHGLSVNVDISLPRTEISIGKRHVDFDVVVHPFMMFSSSSLRRDFTINSMGYCIEYSLLLDPFGGLQCINRRTINCVSNVCFSEDPLRILRAIYFSAKLSFKLSNTLLTMIAMNRGSIDYIPRERIGGEFYKIVCCNNIMSSFVLLASLDYYMFGFIEYLMKLKCYTYFVKKLELISGFCNRVMFISLVLNFESSVFFSKLLFCTPFVTKVKYMYLKSAVFLVKSFIVLNKVSGNDYMLLVCDFVLHLQRVVIDNIVFYSLSLMNVIFSKALSLNLNVILKQTVDVCIKAVSVVSQVVVKYKHTISSDSLGIFKVIIRSLVLRFMTNNDCIALDYLLSSKGIQDIISLLTYI